ncbi:MAG: T9SS type A sorting domain-containing protein [Cyclobacteriaceae bacterium]
MKRMNFHFTGFVLLFLLMGIEVMGQTSPTYTSGGSWNTPITGLNFPTVNIADQDDELTASSLTFASSNARSLTVTSGTLIVTGSVTFDAGKSNAELTVGAGATLIILGDLEMGKNQADGSVDGNVVVLGSVTAAGTGGAFAGSGTIYTDGGVGNNLTTGNSGGAVTIDDLLSGGDPFLEDVHEYVTNNGSDPLPVNLLFFDVAKDAGASLTWATASEINNDYFSIERSEDGINFYEIGQVSGIGNSSKVVEYAYNDPFPVAEVEYYRLLQVDYDGGFEYFETERLELSAKSSNPSLSIHVTDVWSRDFNIVSNEALYINHALMISLSGQEVFDMGTKLEKTGLFSYQLSTADLSKGLYVLKLITTSGDSFTEKIIIN